MWPGGTFHVVVGTLKISLDQLKKKKKKKHKKETQACFHKQAFTLLTATDTTALYKTAPRWCNTAKPRELYGGCVWNRTMSCLAT